MRENELHFIAFEIISLGKLSIVSKVDRIFGEHEHNVLLEMPNL